MRKGVPAVRKNRNRIFRIKENIKNPLSPILKRSGYE